MLPHWNGVIVDAALQLDDLRKKYIPLLQESFSAACKTLLPENQIKLEYRQGWKMGADYPSALNDALDNDKRQGLTSIGPHRCDLHLSTDGRMVAEVFSRGQVKLMVIALYLAQIQLLRQLQNTPCVILIDELAAELDKHHRELVIDTLHRQGHQVFITSTDRGLVDEEHNEAYKVFHVEHGEIKEMV